MSCPRCNAPAAEEMLREFGGVCPKCLLDFSEEQDAPAFPNLEIVEMLGQGGMGVVYKALQKNLNRTVALKVLSPQLSADPEFVERFTREARALASLSHPNIVGIYDSGIHDHVPYLVMEYVDGTPLRKMLASKKLTPERVLEVIPQICDALHYAHAQGVVHRDIKPENILIDRAGRVKIADFGLAKLASLDETRITKTGYVMGSPHYMAPEQFAGAGRVDHRADIYSLGVVFYEMLTGEVPMGRFKPPSAKAAVDQRLDPVVLKSLEREPEDRWQSADEVKARVANLEPVPTEATFVWNGIPILITCAVNPREYFANSITTVYVDGRSLGSPSGILVDRLVGPFRDRQGVEHTIVVESGMSGYEVQIDGALVWQGKVPTQNEGYGCAMAVLVILGVAVGTAAVGVSPWLLLVVIPVFIVAVLALVQRGLSNLSPKVPPPAPPERSDDGQNRILIAVLIVMVVLGLSVAFWQSGQSSKPGEEQSVIAGPLLVLGAMVVTLVLLAGPIRGRYFRRLEPWTPARRQAMIVGIAAGVVACLAIILLFSTVPSPPRPPVVTAPVPPAPLVEAPVEMPPRDPWPVVQPNYQHTGREPFSVDEFWPVGQDLPAGMERAKTLAGAELLEPARFPAVLLDDLEYGRGLNFQNGQAIIVGLQFKTELARRRWQKEAVWKRCLDSWHFRMDGDSQGVILMRHDGSAIGSAVVEMLTATMDRKWREQENAGKNRKK